MYIMDIEKIYSIRAIIPPNRSDGSDGLARKGSFDGDFLVKNVFQILETHPDVPNNYWNKIWKWKGLYRIFGFIWMASLNKLMTTLRGVNGRVTM